MGNDAQTAAGEAAGSPEVTERGTAKGDVTVSEPTRAQQTLARRVAESRATVPDFTVRADVDMETCAATRAGADGAPSFTHLVVKAAALALRDVPQINGSYRDNRFEAYSRVNVAIAVDTGGAFVTPTIFDADTKPLAAIAHEARQLAEAARAGTITARELSGATFTVTNLGMHGVAEVDPVIVTPQAAVLGVGAIAPRLVAGPDGAPAVRRTARLTLSCDHRIVSGVDAARFLAAVRERLEQPDALLA